MSGGLLIRGGRVVDPSLSLDALRDLRISRGLVAEIGYELEPEPGEAIFDARGTIVAPGFVDMHVHLREPGFEEKETIATGTQAALRGGFTAVACMANTNPAIDDPAVLTALMAALAARANCRVHPIAAITRGRRGLEPCDYAGLSSVGAVAFSDDGDTIVNARVLRDAGLAALGVRGAFISHCEDPALKADGVMNEGIVSRELGLPASPALAEDVTVARDLLVASDTKKQWHVAHVTTHRSLELIRQARAAGTNVTCEATPHHLTLTEQSIRELGATAKVNPPLRTEADVVSLRAAVRDGTIDALASDHAPHTAAEKAGGIVQAAVGFSGLEIAVGAYAMALADLPLLRFVALLSTNPARILGVSGGTLAVGSDGDVTIFAERPWRVDPSRFASKGKSTPFAGWTLPRRVVATVVGGELRYDEARHG
ncbi:MAG: dihydroorotase [Candidatus Eremiobacteraeota bacterium]|nr:dihydroorotase [Candidatus Eremiobacteraeota bacterium]